MRIEIKTNIQLLCFLEVCAHISVTTARGHSHNAAHWSPITARCTASRCRTRTNNAAPRRTCARSAAIQPVDRTNILNISRTTTRTPLRWTGLTTSVSSNQLHWTVQLHLKCPCSILCQTETVVTVVVLRPLDRFAVQGLVNKITAKHSVT